MRSKILSTEFDAVTMAEAVARIEAFVAAAPRPHLVVTANPEIVIAAQRDPLLTHVLQRADLVVADGIGVVWASRVLGRPVPERIPGIELMDRLLQRASEWGWRVFLLGAAPGVAQKAREAMEQSCPGLQVVGCRDGYFGRADESQLLAELKASAADLLFVAMGAPKQEKWAAAHLGQLSIPVAMGVGGSFNVWAGVQRRAPLWMQRWHLEWLYRLLSQPQRWRRAAVLPYFVCLVLLQKLQERWEGRK